ncbi:hypothetical protein [Nocardia asteroides]
MVSNAHQLPVAIARMTRRLGVLVMVAVAALLLLGGTAAAQTDQGGGTYGFNDACETIDQTLDIPGLPVDPGDILGTACKAGNAATHPGQAAEAVVNKAWDSTFGKVVESIMQGMGEAMVMSLTWWTKLPNDTLLDSPSLFAKVRAFTEPLTWMLLTASIMICAARVALARRHARLDEAEEGVRVLVRTVVMSWTLSGLLVLGAQAGDRFADWVITWSTNGQAKNIAEAMVQTQVLTAFAPGLVFFIGMVGMFGALAQLVFTLVRQGLIIVVSALLPLAAAGSGFKVGKGFTEKLTMWALGFVLYKPIAAIVYMIAFTAFGDQQAQVVNDGTATVDPETAQRALVGFILLCSAAFVLPALLRLVAPVASMAGGGSGAAIMGGAAGVGAIGATRFMGGGKVPSGAADARSAGVRTGASAAAPPTGAAGGRGAGGAAGTMGAPGAAGAGGAAKAAGGAKAAGAAGAGSAGAAGGPWGAAAAAAVGAVRGGVQRVESTVEGAVDTGSGNGHGGGATPPSGTGTWGVSR